METQAPPWGARTWVAGFVPPVAGNTGLQLDGTNDYVTFGPAPSLGATSFTLETWFKRTGAGLGVATGTNGIVSAIPLVTKGGAENETPANINMNYFLGIDAASGRLVADFEDTVNGGNHPVTGVAVVTSNVWHHAAVTYNASTGTWTLYLDGALDKTLVLASAFQPQSASIQHAALGTSLTSTGAVAQNPTGSFGYFQGVLDEARIWNVVRTAAQISTARDQELTSGTGLIGRWGMSEGTGTVVGNSIGGGVNGTATNGPTWVAGFVPPAAGNTGLQLDGTNDYVTFGAAPSLGATSFTLETWFKRTGAGQGVGTGTNGIVSAIPLVTKGGAENETPANINMNYFLGIDAASGQLVADFEDTVNGGNHPVTGTAVVTSNVWHHAAVTYNASTGTWTLYLDGALDKTLVLASAFQPQSASIQHAALGTSLTSTGAVAQSPSGSFGYFQGVLDEARIWNVVRSAGQISTARDQELTSGTGLIGRWGMSEGTGTVVGNSISGGVNGTATNGPTWVAGFVPPGDPVFVGAGDIADCARTQDTATGALLAGIAGTVWTAGDNVYPTGTDINNYNNCYEPAWGGAIKARTHPVPGNHDWGTGQVPSGSETLAAYFAYYGANANAGGTSYYSYNIPSSNWHVVNLDSECQLVPGGCLASSAQELWLRADLAANASKNVIAIWHKPRFSSGVTNYTALQAFYDDIYEFGVDILLDGHDHVYERLAPMNATGAADPTYGIRQFTVGTGGAALQSCPGTTLSTSVVCNASTYGVLKLTLHATGYDWAFLPIAGQTFTDAGSGLVHAAPPGSNTAPNAPTLNAPTNGATGVGTSPTLDVGVSDPNADPLTVTYYGRPLASGNFAQIAQHSGITAASDTATSGPTWAPARPSSGTPPSATATADHDRSDLDLPHRGQHRPGVRGRRRHRLVRGDRRHGYRQHHRRHRRRHLDHRRQRLRQRTGQRVHELLRHHPVGHSGGQGPHAAGPGQP